VNAVEIVKQVLLRSGSVWVLWFLGALSVLSLAIVVERWMYFRSRDTDIRTLARSLDEQLTGKHWSAAVTELSSMPAAAASIAAAGLRLAGRGASAVDKAMQSAAALERGQLEKRLTYLGTIGNNAPFIGLFGTVIGIIHAFEELGSGGGGAGPGQVASTAIMASLAEALVATAVGILVALPAVAAYNYFHRRTAALLGQTEVLTNLVLAHVVE
jgi:biopolymer transport protein ExbB